MKTFTQILVFIVLLFCGCTEEIEPISGDSTLRAINKCDYSIKIYFDNSYIGKLDSDEQETWSVPSGQHTIKATCNYADDFKRSLHFYSGEITTIILEIENKYSKLISQSVDNE